MKFHVSICCLLVSADLVFFVSCTEPRTKENVADNDKKDDRWQREMKLFQKGLKVTNDKGELVELTTEDAAPSESARRGFENNVIFSLFTQKNPAVRHELSVTPYSSIGTLGWSYFDHRNPTYFITHGWLNTGDSPACTVVRDAYLANHEANVVVVDWGSIAISPYGWAVKNVEYVGKKVAEMIEFLINIASLDPNRTTLIGHSLGAHVMGIAGHYTNGTLNTIFGLDPALPMFSLASRGSRIFNTDAKHVQIIHTNGGFLGFEAAIGTSDFFPDGGSNQFNCLSDIGGSCSHSRAYEYFAESIGSTCGFWGKRCSSKMHFVMRECMGPNVGKMGGIVVRPDVRGNYYLWTSSQTPYALGIEA